MFSACESDSSDPTPDADVPIDAQVPNDARMPMDAQFLDASADARVSDAAPADARVIACPPVVDFCQLDSECTTAGQICAKEIGVQCAIKQCREPCEASDCTGDWYCDGRVCAPKLTN